MDKVSDDLFNISPSLRHVLVCFLKPDPLNALQIVTPANYACREQQVLVEIIKSHVDILS